MKTCKTMTMYITLEYENGEIKVHGHTRGNQDREMIIKPNIRISVEELTEKLCEKMEAIIKGIERVEDLYDQNEIRDNW